MKKPLWKAAFPALLSSLATFEIPEFSVKKAGILKGRGSFQYQFPMPFEVLLRPEPAWAATYVRTAAAFDQEENRVVTVHSSVQF